jgi:hypothetical protein
LGSRSIICGKQTHSISFFGTNGNTCSSTLLTAMLGCPTIVQSWQWHIYRFPIYKRIRSEIDEERKHSKTARGPCLLRPGKRRKRRITSSKTETESTSDRSFTSCCCWSIHHPRQKRSSHVTLRVPASQSLRPRSIQGPASCACICSCRAGASRPVHALCQSASLSR